MQTLGLLVDYQKNRLFCQITRLFGKMDKTMMGFRTSILQKRRAGGAKHQYARGWLLGISLTCRSLRRRDACKIGNPLSRTLAYARVTKIMSIKLKGCPVPYVDSNIA